MPEKQYWKFRTKQVFREKIPAGSASTAEIPLPPRQPRLESTGSFSPSPSAPDKSTGSKRGYQAHQ
ncbi:MAG: hypothetical protein WCA38_14815 [Candidatus Acidiferrales bacterium]